MKLNAGRYYIGDPCYVMDNDSYDELSKKLFGENKSIDGFLTVGGLKMFCHSTDYGDGVYDGIGVDSGHICCMPVELVKKTSEIIKEISIEHVFEDNFECSYKDGTFVFGNISIETGCCEE